MDAHTTIKRIPVQLDLDSKLISAGKAVRALPNVQLETVLASYLALVYDLRAHSSGGEISLRRDDMQSLADTIGKSEDEVINALTRLMNCSASESRRFKKMMKKGKAFIPVGMVAAGAVLVAAFAIGGSPSTSPSSGEVQRAKTVIVQEVQSNVVLASENTSSEVTSDDALDVEIGDAATIENTEDSSGVSN
mgnify:CR=1 FL=1